MKVEDNHFCPKALRENTYSNNKCLLDLKGRKRIKCDMVGTEPTTNVFEAEKGIIFIFNGHNILIRSDCQEDTYINGSVILRYHNCTITINNTEYSDKELLENDKFI